MTACNRPARRFDAFVRALTQGFQVTAGESAEVKVKAPQACEVSQVEGEMLQSSSQTLVTGQVQLPQSREAAERSACRGEIQRFKAQSPNFSF